MNEFIARGYELVDKTAVHLAPKIREYRELGEKYQRETEFSLLPDLYENLHEDNVDFFVNKIKIAHPSNPGRQYFDVIGQTSLIDLDILERETDSEEAYRAAFRNGLDFFMIKMMGDATLETDKYWGQWADARAGKSTEASSKEIELVHDIYENEFEGEDDRGLEQTLKRIAERRINYREAKSDVLRKDQAKRYGQACGALMHHNLDNFHKIVEHRAFFELQGGAAKLADDVKDFFLDRGSNEGYKNVLSVIGLARSAVSETLKARRALSREAKKKFGVFLLDGMLYQAREFLDLKDRS